MRDISCILLLIAIAVIESLQVHAYVPMVREGVEWGYYCNAVDWGPAGKYYYRIQYSGDTLIDGKEFTRAWIYQTQKLDMLNGALSGVCLRDEDGVVYRYLSKEFSKDRWLISNGIAFGKFVGNNPDDYPIKDIIYEFYDENTNVQELVEIDDCQRAIWSSSWILDPNQKFDILEGAGPIKHQEKGFDQTGNVVFPSINLYANGIYSDHYLLYERRVDTGEIVYKSPMYDEFIAGDPTVVGIEGVRIDVTERLLVTVDHLSVRSASADTPLTLYRADGSTAATGTGTVTAPAAGLYVVASPGAGSQKVMLR